MAVQTRSRSASLALEPPAKKRKTTPKPKAIAKAKSGKSTTSKAMQSCDIPKSPPAKKHSASNAKNDKGIEKRLRRFREHAPKSYTDRLQRAQTQKFFTSSCQFRLVMLIVACRMFVIDRSSGGTSDAPEETIELAGTTGNIYSITISKVPSCTCPDNRKGNQCKHIIYVSLVTFNRLPIQTLT